MSKKSKKDKMALAIQRRLAPKPDQSGDVTKGGAGAAAAPAGSAPTYAERSVALTQSAQQARLAADAGKCAHFRAHMGEVERHFVAGANITRALALSFEEYFLPADKAAAENYFNSHYRPALNIRYDQFAWIMAAGKKLPAECKSMADVYPAMQLEFFAAGLLSRPERSGEQQSHDTTPVQTFFNTLSQARAHLDKSLADCDQWDAATRADIRKYVGEHEKWLEGLKQKLATD